MASKALALSDLHRNTARGLGLAMADDDLSKLLGSPDGAGSMGSDADAPSSVGGDDDDDEDKKLQGNALPTVTPGTDGKTPVPTSKEEKSEGKEGVGDIDELKKDLDALEGKLEAAADKKKAGEYSSQLEELKKALPEIKKFVDEKKPKGEEAPKDQVPKI